MVIIYISILASFFFISETIDLGQKVRMGRIHRDLSEDFESSRAFIFVLFLLLQGGVMALLRFGHGEKISSRKVQKLRSQW